MQVLCDIAELIDLLRRRTVHPQGLLRLGNISARFIENVLKGTLKSDTEAARLLYDCRPGERRFITLKSRSLHYLLDILLMLRPKRAQCSSYAIQRHECSLHLAGIKALMLFGKRSTAMLMVRRLYQRAVQRHFTDIAIECLLLLRQDAALRGDRNLYQRYRSELAEKLTVQEAEIFCDGLVQLLQLHHLTGNTPRQQLTSEATHYWLKCDSLRRMYDSRSLHLDYFRLKNFACQADRNFRKGLRVCEEQERYLRRNPALCSRAQTARVAIHRQFYLRALHRYDEARDCGLATLNMLRPGEYNYFVCLEHLLLGELCAQRFAAARDILNRVLARRDIKNIPQYLRNRWQLYESVMPCLEFPYTSAHTVLPKAGNLPYPVAILIDAARLILLLKQGRITHLQREMAALNTHPEYSSAGVFSARPFGRLLHDIQAGAACAFRSPVFLQIMQNQENALQDELPEDMSPEQPEAIIYARLREHYRLAAAFETQMKESTGTPPASNAGGRIARLSVQSTLPVTEPTCYKSSNVP